LARRIAAARRYEEEQAVALGLTATFVAALTPGRGSGAFSQHSEVERASCTTAFGHSSPLPLALLAAVPLGEAPSLRKAGTRVCSMNVGGWELLLLIIFVSVLAALFFGVRASTRKDRR